MQYTSQALGENSWQYDFTVANADPTLSFDEVTIYFDVTKFKSLSLAAFPADWNALIIQPDNSIPADGYLDVVKMSGPLTAGSSASGFLVDAEYVGAGEPSAQHFELYQSSDFTLKFSGSSTLDAVTGVPEPTTRAGGLLVMGLAHARRKLNPHGPVLAAPHTRSTST